MILNEEFGVLDGWLNRRSNLRTPVWALGKCNFSQLSKIFIDRFTFIAAYSSVFVVS